MQRLVSVTWPSDSNPRLLLLGLLLCGLLTGTRSTVVFRRGLRISRPMLGMGTMDYEEPPIFVYVRAD